MPSTNQNLEEEETEGHLEKDDGDDIKALAGV